MKKQLNVMFFMLFLLFHVVLWLGAAAAAAQRGRGTAHNYDMENKIITRFKNI